MTHEEVLDEVNVIYERISNNENNLFSDGNYTEALEILIDFYETGLIEELEKIKAEIQKEKCTKCCLPHIIKECNNSKNGREWCEYYYCLKIINEHISKLKGE